MPHHTIRRSLHPGDGFSEALRASGPVDGVGERGKFGNATRVGTRQPVYGAPVRAAWVILLCALGCATTGQGPPASSPRITVSEPGGQVVLTVGQELAVELRTNVTTGYRWELVPPVPEVVTVIDPGTYSAAPGSEGRVGAGGTTSVVFRALRPGKGVVSLAYRRPWETDIPPARTVRFDVEVR
jgi:inhibitor of cysteine peptidase